MHPHGFPKTNLCTKYEVSVYSSVDNVLVWWPASGRGRVRYDRPTV